MKGSYCGVWFLWPAVIIYPGLGVELRIFKWQIGIHRGWAGELGPITVSPSLIGPTEKHKPMKSIFRMIWGDMVLENEKE